MSVLIKLDANGVDVIGQHYQPDLLTTEERAYFDQEVESIPDMPIDGKVYKLQYVSGAITWTLIGDPPLDLEQRVKRIEQQLGI